MIVFKGCMLQGGFKEVFRVFQRSFKGLSKNFEGCFMEDRMLFCFQLDTVVTKCC